MVFISLREKIDLKYWFGWHQYMFSEWWIVSNAYEPRKIDATSLLWGCFSTVKFKVEFVNAALYCSVCQRIPLHMWLYQQLMNGTVLVEGLEIIDVHLRLLELPTEIPPDSLSHLMKMCTVKEYTNPIQCSFKELISPRDCLPLFVAKRLSLSWILYCITIACWHHLLGII